MKTKVSQQAQMVPALLRFLAILGVIVIVVLYGAGGWYFSDQLKADVLDVVQFEPGPDVLVTASSDETIALDTIDDVSVRNDGWYGLVWDGGSGMAGPIIETVGTSVVREFVVLEGDPVGANEMVDFDPWVWLDPQQGLGLDYSEVTYESPLGEMSAWEIPGESRDWVITVHGKGAEKREGLRIADIAHRAGFNVLLIDYRNDVGVPADPSGEYQYGVTEWEDLEAAVNYVIGKRGDRIVLAGMSTGGAISLSFLYESTLASEIDMLILDSPNVAMEQTVRHGASQRDLPVIGLTVPDSLATAAMWISERRFGIDFARWNYLDERLVDLSLPILTIHGDRDATVPLQVSVDLSTARPDLVQYERFDDAEHVAAWNIDRARYEAIVTEFLIAEVP